jgi:hypothetical protein
MSTFATNGFVLYGATIANDRAARAAGHYSWTGAEPRPSWDSRIESPPWTTRRLGRRGDLPLVSTVPVLSRADAVGGCLRRRAHYLDITGELAVFEAMAAQAPPARRRDVPGWL